VKRLAVIVATWFGCGYWPWGPGTAGSIAAIVIAWIAVHFAGFGPRWFLLWAGALAPVGVWAASAVERKMGITDPSIVVVDEVAGQWLTLAGAVTLNWKSWTLALILFRIFDIWKPFPARRLERLPAGSGIMADDIMAGLYGALVLFVAGCFNLY
jgi:phosphatidylglycerophosphatase A